MWQCFCNLIFNLHSGIEPITYEIIKKQSISTTVSDEAKRAPAENRTDDTAFHHQPAINTNYINRSDDCDINGCTISRESNQWHWVRNNHIVTVVNRALAPRNAQTHLTQFRSLFVCTHIDALVNVSEATHARSVLTVLLGQYIFRKQDKGIFIAQFEEWCHRVLWDCYVGSTYAYY